MTEQIDTIIIGAGQGGLSTSYSLTQQGREHIILEQADTQLDDASPGSGVPG